MKPNAEEKRLLAGERAQTRHTEIQKLRSTPGQHRERGHTPEVDTREEESSNERAGTQRKRLRSRGAGRDNSTSGEGRARQKTSIEQKAREDAQRQPSRHTATGSKRRNDTIIA